jgi:hypothetical protein
MPERRTSVLPRRRCRLALAARRGAAGVNSSIEGKGGGWRFGVRVVVLMRV